MVEALAKEGITITANYAGNIKSTHNMPIHPSSLRAIYKRISRRQVVSKSQAVRDYLNAHPAARSQQITAALNEQGIIITVGHVSSIRSRTKKRAKKAAAEAAAVAVEPHADTLTLDQIKKIAKAIKTIRSRSR